MLLIASWNRLKVVLPWRPGNHDLRGINLVFDRVIRKGPIVYEHGALDLTCEEKAVTWLGVGLDYTFLVFTLVKK